MSHLSALAQRLFVAMIAAVALSACHGMQLRSPIAPSSGPPTTFVQTNSDARATRLIDIKDGITKAVAFKAATDLLAQRFTVDVTDQHAGFLMTPWQSSFIRGGAPDLHYRTRIIIRFLGDDWKQVSVRADANWERADNWDIGYDSKLLDEVTLDLRSRLGKQP